MLRVRDPLMVVMPTLHGHAPAWLQAPSPPWRGALVVRRETGASLGETQSLPQLQHAPCLIRCNDMKMNRINWLSGIVINLCYLNKSCQRAAITPISDKYWFMLWIPPFALSPIPCPSLSLSTGTWMVQCIARYWKKQEIIQYHHKGVSQTAWPPSTSLLKHLLLS